MRSPSARRSSPGPRPKGKPGSRASRAVNCPASSRTSGARSPGSRWVTPSTAWRIAGGTARPRTTSACGRASWRPSRGPSITWAPLSSRRWRRRCPDRLFTGVVRPPDARRRSTDPPPDALAAAGRLTARRWPSWPASTAESGGRGAGASPARARSGLSLSHVSTGFEQASPPSRQRLRLRGLSRPAAAADPRRVARAERPR